MTVPDHLAPYKRPSMSWLFVAVTATAVANGSLPDNFCAYRVAAERYPVGFEFPLSFKGNVLALIQGLINNKRQ